jgi:hypothetical protein
MTHRAIPRAKAINAKHQPLAPIGLLPERNMPVWSAATRDFAAGRIRALLPMVGRTLIAVAR